MIRVSISSAVAVGLAIGLSGTAYAQSKPSVPSDFKYELQGSQRVEKPDSRTKAADGTVREEFRSGKCVTVKERRPDGAVKTSQKCE